MAREQPVVAWDFLGVGLNMGDMANGDDEMGKENFVHGADRSASPLLNMAGTKNSAWTMQHLLPLRGSIDERFKEQIAENLKVWRQGNSLKNSSGLVREEYGSSVPISGGFRSPITRTVISAPKAEAMAVPATTEMRLPSSGITDKQHDTPLTIFYAGSVQVFNNISAEQAQAIIRLASVGDVQGNPVDPDVMSMNRTATSFPQDKSLNILRSNQAVVNQQAKANEVNELTTNMQLDFEHLNIPAPSSPGHSGQPLVPTALPHARKASLARFLEKRRERAHSKCPYSVRREDSSLPEERLSSSNDPTCYAHCRDRVDKKKGLVPYWMERVAECSTSDVVVKEQKITVT